MAVLEREYAIFNRMKDRLEAEHYLEWVVIHEDEFIGAFKDFQVAADTAVRRFGRGPYLIEQVGAPPPSIPSILGYAPAKPALRQAQGE